MMVRLFFLTALTMVAFAANSLLNRAALVDGSTGPAAFAALRLASGALCLAGLLVFRNGMPRLMTRTRAFGAGSLALYMLGFSFAYTALDAGIGALILFGVVQLTMFSGGVLSGERPAPSRWLGSAFAVGGLALLVWPSSDAALPTVPLVLMIAAAIGWGVYSLIGRGAHDPLQETAGNFIVATPLALLIWVVLPDGISMSGVALAVVSGAVTSGLGYALWYTVLPRLEATVAALSQLTVPVIAVVAGALILSEPLTLRLVIASAIILGGVAFGILGQRKMGSKTS